LEYSVTLNDCSSAAIDFFKDDRSRFIIAKLVKRIIDFLEYRIFQGLILKIHKNQPSKKFSGLNYDVCYHKKTAFRNKFPKAVHN